MLQQFLGIENINRTYWALSVEIGFYFLIFLIACLKLTKRLDLVLWVWMGILLVDFLNGWLGRSSLALSDPSLLASEVIMTAQPTRNFGDILSGGISVLQHTFLSRVLLLKGHASLFLFGMALFQGHKNGFSPTRILLLVLSILIRLFHYSPNGISLEAQIGVLVCPILLVLAVMRYLDFLNVKILLTLGAFSYTTYVVHLPIAAAVIAIFKYFHVLPELSVIATVMISCVLSWLIWKYLELPLVAKIKRVLLSF